MMRERCRNKKTSRGGTGKARCCHKKTRGGEGDNKGEDVEVWGGGARKVEESVGEDQVNKVGQSAN